MPSLLQHPTNLLFGFDLKKWLGFRRRGGTYIFFRRKRGWGVREIKRKRNSLHHQEEPKTSFSTNMLSTPLSSRYLPQHAIITFSMWNPPKPRKMLLNAAGLSNCSSFAIRYTPSSHHNGPD